MYSANGLYIKSFPKEVNRSLNNNKPSWQCGSNDAHYLDSLEECGTVVASCQVNITWNDECQ
jgi:hypothetical protein